MNKRKKVIIVISALVGFCVISWSHGFRSGLFAGEYTSGMAEVISAERQVACQMANADCNGVKHSINKYLAVIEQYKHLKKGVYTETAYYADKMLGHLRLALIEEKQGNLKERSKHLAIAKEACSHRHGDDCSEGKLFWYEKRFEEKHPIACLAK